MMEKQKYVWLIVAAVILAGINLIGQDIDEDSLLAEEDISLSDAVEGDLPSDDAGDDDLLAELLADDSDDDDDADLLADDIPLESLDNEAEEPADDSIAGAPEGLDDGDLGNEIDGLDSDVPAEEPTPVAEADKPSDDKPVADAGDSDDMLKDLGLDSSEPEESVAAAEDDSLDSLLGELTEDEPDENSQPVVEEPPLANDQVAEEKGVDADDSDDMDALLADLADEEEADLDVADTPDAVEPAAVEPEKVAAEKSAAPVEIADESAPVEIADDKPAYVDDMAIDDDLFKSLASEAKDDMDVAKAVETANEGGSHIVVPLQPESDADDLLDALVNEEEAGLVVPDKEPEAAPSSVEEPQAAPAAVEEPEADAVKVDPAVSAFATAERTKRIGIEAHAIESVRKAEEDLAKKNYPAAIVKFEEALKYLPYRDDLVPIRERARKGLGGALYLRALSFERMDELENAKASALESVKYGNKRAEDAVRRIQKKIEAPDVLPPPPPKHRWQEDEYLDTEKQVKAWLKRGREAYLTGEYERAILSFESVLARDPENKEAMRLKRNAAHKRYDRSEAERDGTRFSMMAEVMDAWSQKRKYGEYETPVDSRVGGEDTVTDVEDKKRAAVITKMMNIHIPEVDFRQANIRDVVRFLHTQSVEFDPSENSDERKGVNFILKLGTDEQGGGDVAEAAPSLWDEDAGGLDDAGGGAGGSETLITFSALDITLKEALDIVVDIANLKYLIRGNIVKIMPKNAATSEIEHRMYNVLSSAIGRLEELSSAVTSQSHQRGNGGFMEIESNDYLGGEEIDLKKFFAEMGVEWPEKSSIKYVRGLGKLVVANTLENLTVFEKVLKVLNVVPYQIEIEARFVEVAQTDISSLGLEWMLNDNWEIAEKKSDAGKPLSARQRIIMEENGGGGGFTRANRFATDLTGVNEVSDDLMKFTSILTNPELSVILHAMQQQGHTDLLSAPKVTTQSGQQATIKVVTEYIYPTTYTLIEAQGRGGINAGIAPPAVEPGSFETREVGVILEVLPEVSPDGQMINLSLSPQVVNEPEWHDYGYDYFLGNVGGGVVTSHLRMEQPFFHSRSLQTSLLIYNGATVVMGGMITEVRENVDDKIPVLGDIPFIGHLFRSQYEASRKRNLLIFVTARLVDPSGRPLNSDKFGMDGTIAAKIATQGDESTVSE